MTEYMGPPLDERPRDHDAFEITPDGSAMASSSVAWWGYDAGMGYSATEDCMEDIGLKRPIDNPKIIAKWLEDRGFPLMAAGLRRFAAERK